MRIGVVVSFVAFLLLAQPMLVMRTVHAQASPVYFSVEPVAVASLIDINVSVNGLETPGTPSPVGQFFTVEIHLRGATQTNVPAGVAGVEVHFYFGNILSYAVPTGFTNMIGQAGGVLSGVGAIYGIYAGFYDSNNNPVDFAPYTGAVYYEVAAAAHGIWNEADGIVAKITFEITRQPQSSQGEQRVSFPLALVEIGPGLVDGNAVTIPHDIVQGTLNIDANTLPLAVDYLVRNYNATVGLIPEVPGGSTYWLYSDNFLASYALWRYDPSNSTLANIVTGISSTISKIIQTVPYPLNQYMVLNSSIAAFNDSSDYTIAHYGDAVINIALNNGTGALNPSDYADIAFLEALYYHSIGQVQNASLAYQIGASMFDGKGLNDTLFQNGSQEGQYQTFKLALYVYVGKVLGQQFSPNAETTLLKMQADSGGFYTGYDENYSTNGTNTNAETTSLAILALLELSGGTININADGSIFPPTAPVTTVDNVTYTFVGNINSSIVVERNSVIVDGNGYTLQGPGTGTGFSLSGVTNVTIENTTIADFTNGIWLNYSSSNTFSGNNITANKGDGIWVGSASGKNTFSGNNVANNRYGIWLNVSVYNTLSGNDVANNWVGIELDYSSGNTLSGNTVTANNVYGIKLLSSSGNTLSSNDVENNGDGIWLLSSSNNTLSGNDVANNWVGVEFVSSSGSTLSGNTVTANSNVGVEFVSSSGSTLSGNTVTANLEVGVELLSSSNNTLSGNDVANNWVGVEFVSSSGSTLSGNTVTANSNVGVEFVSSYGNSVFHNSFVNNTRQVYPQGSSNIGDGSFPLGGNFWSDYDGSDSNHDGIGDLNYTIDASNVDRYPLMGTFSSFSVSSEQSVETICNSTISGFAFNGTAISFDVSGDPGTTGFCRICIPTALMNESYNVFVNGTEVAYTLLPFSNSTHTYLYFSYTHSTQQVTVIPEESTLTILLLLVTLSSLTILSAKKRTRKRLT